MKKGKKRSGLPAKKVLKVKWKKRNSSVRVLSWVLMLLLLSMMFGGLIGIILFLIFTSMLLVALVVGRDFRRYLFRELKGENTVNIQFLLRGKIYDFSCRCKKEEFKRLMLAKGFEVVKDSSESLSVKKAIKIGEAKGLITDVWNELKLNRKGALREIIQNLPSAPIELKEVVVSPEIEPSDVHISFKIPYSDLHKGILLGEGAGGKVLKGTCRNIGQVAIKQIEDAGALQVLQGITARQAFMQEAQIMGQLQHPNLARLWGISGGGEEGHHYSMVMEYIPKGSLYGVIHGSESLSWRQRWQIAIDIGNGLAFLHGRDILHHDLKSPNVLLGDDMQAKISDFGLSVIRPSPGELPPHIASQTLCDNRWKAPELFATGERYTKEADVFSYGIILWELATGRMPTGGKPRKKTIPADCPDSFKAIIRRCWRTRPGDRCTIQDALQDLEAHKREVGLR
jgi:serine/threonine protein kinase